MRPLPLLSFALSVALTPACGRTPEDGGSHAQAQPQRERGEPRDGLLYASDKASPGYTLLAPLQSTSTYLIDMAGEPVHEWPSEHKPGQGAYLLENGHLLRACRLRDSAFVRGGQGGRLEQRDWDGRLVWEFDFSSADYIQHHDVEPLPNGNVLVIAWERKSRAEAIARGRDPDQVGEDGMWPDFVAELEPVGARDARVVWEWHAWDHLVQDRDPEREGFGEIADFPGRIDINGVRTRGGETAEQRERESEREDQLRALGYLGGDESEPAPAPRGGAGPADWLHTNSIDYHPELDQIVLSVRSFNELWVIDHSTTTEEAAGSSGGDSGRGGELLYRWGNPRAYGAARAIDRTFFLQHDVQWIPPGLPGAGNLLVFNNGRGRPRKLFSEVLELEPPLEPDGGYRLRAGEPYGPERALWSYCAPERERFYSGHVSGAQRLPNGNTLVCSGEQGWIFELDESGEIVWEFVNPFGRSSSESEERRTRSQIAGPFGGRGAVEQGYGGLFRAVRVPPDHPGLAALRGAPGGG